MYLTCTQNDLSAHGLVFKSLVIQFCLIISCSDYEYKHTFIEIFQKKKLKTFLIDVPDMPVISLTCVHIVMVKNTFHINLTFYQVIFKNSNRR